MHNNLNMSHPPRSLSLRVKFLLLLTLLPLLVLGAYLTLAIDVFQSDKVAYVFEETTSISRTLALQTTSYWNSLLSNVRPVLADFTRSGTFSSMARSLLPADSQVQWIAVTQFDDQLRLNLLAYLGRDGLTAGEGEAKVLSESQFVVEKAAKGRRTMLIPFKDDRILFLETVDGLEEGKTLVFMVLAEGKELFSAFRSPGSTTNYLIDDMGLILMGPSEFERTYLSQQFPLNFLAAEKAQTGTEEVNDHAGEAVLLSYSPITSGSFYVVSTVPRKAALEAVQTLIRKSLIFFALLFCATLIVSLIASKNLTGALTQLFQATQKVAQGKFDIRVAVNSGDEVGSLAQSFNKMAAEVSRLMSETAEKARMESELRTAQTVQETLFPPVSAKIGDLSVFGYYEPASECGGDWWHYNWVDGKVFLWIGDATGHGAPAALITSAAKSASTVIENLKVDPSTALGLLNRSIYDVSQGKIMMTFFLACYDPVTRQLTYSNASHESPYLIRRNALPPKKKDLIPLNEVNNPRLGQSREAVYEQVTIDLQPGDRILFYTDGIPDIQNEKEEAWGERAFLKAVLQSNKDYPPVSEAVARLTKDFGEHRQKAPLLDDITFFMVELEAGGNA